MTVMDNEDPALPEAEIDECEAVIACLGDDAALLRRENPDCEIAANMDAAADMLEKWRDAANRLAAAPVAIMDTRVSLGLCAPTEEDFPKLYALQGRRVALVDLGA